MDHGTSTDEHVRVEQERRAPERALFTADQLLGRSPIWLRRTTDRRRLAAHVIAVVALVALTVWWVVPLHAFAGPVLLQLAPGHGVHAGDLPTLAFLALALRSLRSVQRIVQGA